jgi:hypothetical protein
VDDEQGPWWTRPPEPGPQARAPRRDAEQYAPAEPQAPAARPLIRRGVAAPPQVDPEPSDRTETLPAVEDDIFATFSGPIPQVGNGTASYSPDRVTYPPEGADGAGADGGADDPLNPWQDDKPHGFPNKLPEGRVLLLAGAGGLVLLLIVLVAMISGGGGGSEKPPKTAVAAKSTVNTTSEMPGKVPDGLKRVNDSDATALLRKAGEGAGGTIVEAWGWKDKNGQNLVVTSAETTKSGKQTLRVVQVAGLGRSPKVLRLMQDPNLPTSCKSTGSAGFTRQGLVVRDLDSSGIAEVLVGWSSRCGGKGTDSEVKLALISNGQKFIIRGKGVIGEKGSGDRVPAPRSSEWPGGYFKTLTAMFQSLYY